MATVSSGGRNQVLATSVSQSSLTTNKGYVTNVSMCKCQKYVIIYLGVLFNVTSLLFYIHNIYICSSYHSNIHMNSSVWPRVKSSAFQANFARLNLGDLVLEKVYSK